MPAKTESPTAPQKRNAAPMPGNSRLDQSLVPSLIDGIAMKTVEMKNPIANAMISLVFMVMPFGRATPVRVQAALIFDDFRLPQE